MAGSKAAATLSTALVTAGVGGLLGGCSDDGGGDGDDGGAGASTSADGGGGAAGCLSCGDVLARGVQAVGELCADQVSLWQEVNDCACEGCIAACNCIQGEVQSIDGACGACLLAPSCSARSDACEAGHAL